jgi:hypothetical protein
MGGRQCLVFEDGERERNRCHHDATTTTSSIATSFQRLLPPSMNEPDLTSNPSPSLSPQSTPPNTQPPPKETPSTKPKINWRYGTSNVILYTPKSENRHGVAPLQVYYVLWIVRASCTALIIVRHTKARRKAQGKNRIKAWEEERALPMLQGKEEDGQTIEKWVISHPNFCVDKRRN